MARLTAAWQKAGADLQQISRSVHERMQSCTLAAGEVHGLLYVLLLSKPNPFNKHVHDCDIFTTLYVVILVSHFSPPPSRPQPLSSAAVGLCCVQIKAANNTTSVLTGCFILPYYPHSFAAPFHWRRTVTCSICSSYGRPRAWSIPRAQNKPNGFQLPSSHRLFGVSHRLDMMILRLQCKRIVLQFFLACAVHVTTQSGQ